MNKKTCCVFFMAVLFSVNAFALVAPNVKYLPAGNSFNSYKHLFETQVKGQALEATARTNFMANGKGIEQLNVTYNGGKNGLDGAFIKRDKYGHIRQFYVQEVKSGNAKLSLNKQTPQMSRQWILDDIEKSMARGSSAYGKNAQVLETARSFVKNDVNMKRFVDRVNLENGRLKIERTYIGRDLNYQNVPLKNRSIDNVFEVSGKKVIADIPVLDKYATRLTPYQKRVRDDMFNSLSVRMKKNGFSDSAVSRTLYEIRTNPNITTKGSGSSSLAVVAARNQVAGGSVYARGNVRRTKAGIKAAVSIRTVLPFALGFIDAATDIMDFVTVYSDWQNLQINKQTFVIRASGIAGGIIAGEALGYMGASLGNLICPGLGGLVGGIIGGSAGYILGEVFCSGLAEGYYNRMNNLMADEYFDPLCEELQQMISL